ncbi:hypothetical protein [Zooshikella ganghwensis]|uniref:hypothetical protein n=1 Tax=Zooshikella ganghwensis TaxID=202772 RepID=UPI00048A19BD|nr:hypothetical protein [Zooshikella ganghwensis]
MTETIESRVKSLFEQHREVPGAEFDESYFIDFLMANPKGKGAFRNSFSGLRRFNAFCDKVQLEFGICFSVKDRDTDFSFLDFCERVKTLRKSSRGSKASLKNQMRYRFEWNIFVLANILLFALLVVFRNLEVVFVLTFFLAVYLNYKLILSYKKEREYLKALEAKIIENENN